MENQIRKFNFYNQNEIDLVIELAWKVLSSGGLVVHPTDTCYGLAADITNRQALKNILFFKKRKNSLFNVIVNSREQWEDYGEWHPIIQEVINKNPGKQFSFIVPRTEKTPSFFSPGTNTIGMQIPKIKFSLDLLSRMGKPLVATSANLSGLNVCYSIKDLLLQLGGDIVFPFELLILDAGEIPHKRPSTIFEVKNNGELMLIRE
ncbi:MAG: L-threonylcarbamoyladenylate synthase [Candidatus Gastranaerophilaceae bacterium]|jgi:L-threonylcarbamoyladenylate synthase